MARVHPGRYAARIEGDFVVFVIGMRFNKPWKVREWMPVFRAMPTMLNYLEEHPEKGLLGYRQTISGLSPISIQYWRSFEHLEAFARDADDPHLEPWREFNRRVGGNGDVGIFHETYQVRAGEYESIYGNMPRTMLAAAGEHVPVGSTSRARGRMQDGL